MAEISNLLRGDLLSENPQQAASSFGPHRVVPDRWKGMSQEQLEDIRLAQKQQIQEKLVPDPCPPPPSAVPACAPCCCPCTAVGMRSMAGAAALDQIWGQGLRQDPAWPVQRRGRPGGWRGLREQGMYPGSEVEAQGPGWLRGNLAFPVTEVGALEGFE